MFSQFDLLKVREGVVLLIALILSVAVHEFGHAFSADKLGDSRPRQDGRVTLNPMVHIDPMGTLLVPIIAFLSSYGLLGWGRPVETNQHTKRNSLIISIAGPAMNVVLAVVVTLLYVVLVATGLVDPTKPIADGIYQVIRLNWILCFFNLLPCPPLDGGAVLAGLLPPRYDYINRFLKMYGPFILLGLLITGMLSYFLIPAMFIARQSWIFANGLFGYTLIGG